MTVHLQPEFDKKKGADVVTVACITPEFPPCDAERDVVSVMQRHSLGSCNSSSAAGMGHWRITLNWHTLCCAALHPQPFHCQPSDSCSNAAGSWADNSPGSVWLLNQSMDSFPWTSSPLNSSNPSCKTITQLLNLCLAQSWKNEFSETWGNIQSGEKGNYFFYQLLSWWPKKIPSFPMCTVERFRTFCISYEVRTAQRK